MPWEVELDFDSNESTMFGPRLELGPSLFQVDTISTISSNEEVDENPHICAAARYESLCIAASNNAFIFTDNGREFSGLITLDGDPSEIIWAQDKMFLVIACKSKTIHFCSSSPQILFSKTFPENVVAMQFTDINQDDNCSLLVLTPSSLHVFSHLALPSLKQALEDEDMESAQSLQAEIKFNTVDFTRVDLPAVTAFFFINQRLVTAHQGMICQWIEKDKEFVLCSTYSLMSDKGVHFTKLTPLGSGTKFLSLNNQGQLSLWDTSSLIKLRQWPMGDIIDYTILIKEDKKQIGLDEMQIILHRLVESEIDGKAVVNSLLSVCDLPSLKSTYDLKLNKFTILASAPGLQETTFLVEGIKDEQNESEIIDTLKVRGLMESAPETRYYRLLSKKQFKDAEQFAKLYGLDIEMVYKMRSTHCLDLIAPWSGHNLDEIQREAYIEDIKTCLQNITDLEHITEYCIKAFPPDYATTLEFLHIAKTKLNETGLKNDEELFLMTNVLDAERRLYTFRRIMVDFDAQMWHEFFQGNLKVRFLEKLAWECFDEALIIWERHHPEFVDDMDLDILCDILDCLKRPTPVLQGWLERDLLPFVIRVLPQGLSMVADWLCKKALDMELDDKTKWPANALSWCELLQRSLSQSSSTIRLPQTTTPVVLTNQMMYMSPNFWESDDSADINRNKSFENLSNLTADLKRLQRLHDVYKCYLSLTEFRKETRESITYRMLDRVAAVELIPSSIKEFVLPYMKEQGLKKDKMLFQYIEDLAEKSGNYSSALGGSAWEMKAIAVIACISDPGYKCRAVMDAIKRAHLPWSKPLQTLVNETLKLKHARVEGIKNQCILSEIHLLTIDYGIGKCTLNSRDQQEKLALFIVRQDRPTAVEDALKVCKAYSMVRPSVIYTCRTDFLISENRVDEMVDFFSTLDDQNQKHCAEMILRSDYIRHDVRNTWMDSFEEIVKIRLCYLKAAVFAADYLKRTQDEDYARNIEEECLHLRNMWSIACRFGIHLSLEEYNDEAERKHLLRNVIRSYFTKKGKAEIKILDVMTEINPEKLHQTKKWTLDDIFKFARLLMVSEAELCRRLSINALEQKQASLAVKYCRMLQKYPVNKEKCAVYKEVVKELMRLHSQTPVLDGFEDGSLPKVILEFAVEAGLISGDDKECSDLVSYARQVCEINKQCSADNFGNDSFSFNSNFDPYNEWVFDAHYKEDVLVMEYEETIPLAYGYVLSVLTLRGKSPSEDDFHEFRKKTFDLLNHLEGCNQYVLATQIAVNTFVLIGAVEHFEQLTNLSKQATNELHGYLQKLWETYLEKIAKHQFIDKNLATGILLHFSEASVWKTLMGLKSQSSQQFKRLMVLAEIGNNVATILEDQKVRQICENEEKNASWLARLHALKIKNEFSIIDNNVSQWLDLIVHGEHCDVKTIIDFCRDYDCIVEQALFRHLTEILIVQRKPEKASPVIQHIIDSGGNIEDLKKILTKIDDYNYESLQCVLSAIVSNFPDDEEAQKQLKLVKYLTTYKRVAPSADEELRSYKEDEDDQGGFSPLAEERMPFHRLLEDNPWEIINPELNKDTIKQWELICTLLNLNLDYMYMRTVHNAVQTHVDQLKVAQKSLSNNPDDQGSILWEEDHIDRELMEALGRILQKITDTQSAAKCSMWFSDILPKSTEKVLALRYHLSIVRKWKNSCKTDEERKHAEEVMQVVSVRHEKMLTEQILHRFSLADPVYVALIKKQKHPIPLILRLYEHPAIGDNSAFLPDIHRAVDQIIAIYEDRPDISRIHVNRMLMSKWLPSCKKGPDANTTINLGEGVSTGYSKEEMETDELNMKRMIYLMNYDQVKSNLVFLKSYAERADISNLLRLRSLRCVYSLRALDNVDDDTKSLCSKISHEMDFPSSLYYTVRLEEIGITIAADAFPSSNKEALVRGIWRSHSNQKQAVQIVADICIDYGITDVQVWNGILRKLVAFKMVDYLRDILVLLSHKLDIVKLEVLQKAWSMVLFTPLDVTPPFTEDVIRGCVEVAFLLNRIPECININTHKLAQQYLNLQLPALALVCVLQHPPMAEVNQEQILRNIDFEDVERQVGKFDDLGFSLPMRDKVLSYCTNADQLNRQDRAPSR